MQTKLILRPDSDEPTIIGSYYLEKAKLLIEEAGIQVLDLNSEAVNLQKVVEIINDFKPVSVYANGHGEKDIFFGQNMEVLIEKGKNDNIFQGMVVHLLACQTGKDNGLLESLVENGAVAAIGYNTDFVIGFSSRYMSDDLTNEASQSLVKPDVQIEYSLAHGASIAEAIIDSDKVSDEEINRWMRSGHEDRDFIIWALINNRDSKVVYGIPSIQPRSNGSNGKVIAGVAAGIGIIATILFTNGVK